MAEEIVNRVANSGLIDFDLTSLIPSGERKLLDIADFMYEGVMIREKDFRDKVEAHDWNQYQNCFVAVTCSVDSIIPLWVYMILSSSLAPYAKFISRGNLPHLESALLRREIEALELKPFEDQRVIIKGCGGEIQESAYLYITARLQTVAKSILFGEACSTVPVFKRPKS